MRLETEVLEMFLLYNALSMFLDIIKRGIHKKNNMAAESDIDVCFNNLRIING